MPSNFAFDVTFDEGTSFSIEKQTDEVDISLTSIPSFSFVAVPGEKGEKGDQGIQGIPGPKGDKGDQGDIGTEWWYGDGEPTVVIGSKPGDYYVDNLTGLVYKLI